MSIRVLIADDHPVVRDGLRFTIERSRKGIEIMGEAADGMEVLSMAAKDCADVFIVDITMPRLNGLETARELVRKYPAAKVIILSLHDARTFIEQAIRVGARGYLVKETASANIVEAICEVHAGRFYLSPSITNVIIENMLKRTGKDRVSQRAAELTSRERKVLQLIAEGSSSKEIAAQLGLALNTVHAHRANLMAKLDIHKQADLVRFAVKAGIAKL